MMAQSIGSMISGTTYPSDDPELVAVEADYAAKEAALQAEIDNIESSHPGYDEYRYDLDMIGHDPHELAAYLSAVLQGYTRASAQAELERIFACPVPADADRGSGGTLPHRDPDRQRGQRVMTVEVPYNYYILNVTLSQQAHILRGFGAADAGAAGDVPGVPADAGQQAADIRRRFRRHQRLRELGRCGVCERHPARQSGGGGHRQKPGGQRGRSALLELVRLYVPCGVVRLLMCPGATARWGCPSRALQPASPRVFRGSSRMDNGAGGITPTSPPATPSSSIGTWMAAPTMWASWWAPTAAGSTPWKVIPATPARSRAIHSTYECIKGYGLMNW